MDKRCALCGSRKLAHCATVEMRPAGEVDYQIPADAYFRQIYRCDECSVYSNLHSCLPDTFYEGSYNEAAYGDRFRKRFEAVMALPPERSDNKHRAERIDAFLRARSRAAATTRLLDIGSGLGVFPAEMKARGYQVFSVDPDERSVRHAREVVGVCGAWVGSTDAIPEGERFDLVTLNKVLEHIPSPLDALRAATRTLADDGVIYVELPDGEAAAAAEGFIDRSEFYVEHLTAYDPTSLRWLIESAALRPLKIDRLHEPSGKYTVYAMAEPNG